MYVRINYGEMALCNGIKLGNNILGGTLCTASKVRCNNDWRSTEPQMAMSIHIGGDAFMGLVI